MEFDETDRKYVDSLIPDNTICTGLLTVVTWIDAETGQPTYRLWCDVDMPVSSALGYLELAKAELLQRCFDGLPDTRRPDPDDE